jgi:hypothetical protein
MVISPWSLVIKSQWSERRYLFLLYNYPAFLGSEVSQLKSLGCIEKGEEACIITLNKKAPKVFPCPSGLKTGTETHFR